MVYKLCSVEIGMEKDNVDFDCIIIVYCNQVIILMLGEWYNMG